MPNVSPVLIIDGKSVQTSRLVRYLAKHGYQSSIATAAVDALHKLCSSEFAIVLLDLDIKLMDGCEITEMFRRFEAREGLERTPVIGMIRPDPAHDIERCLRAGMDDYLFKPVDTEPLEQKLSYWLDLDTDKAEATLRAPKTFSA